MSYIDNLFSLDDFNYATLFDPANAIKMTNGKSVILPYSDVIRDQFLAGMSIGMWINLQAATATNFVFGQYVNTTKFWELYLRPAIGLGRGWYLTYKDDAQGITTPQTINIGGMSEITQMADLIGIRFNFATSPVTFSAFSGGKDLYNSSMQPIFATFNSTFIQAFTGVDFHLGRQVVNNTIYRDYTFFSTENLTKAQWQRIYNNRKGVAPITIPGITNAWTFDNGSGTAYLGSSANRNIDDVIGGRPVYATGYNSSIVDDFVTFRNITW